MTNKNTTFIFFSWLSRYARGTLAVIIAAGLTAPLAHAVEVTPGTRYEGEVRLEAPEAGVAFTLPAGFFGILDPNLEMFIAQHRTSPGRLFIAAEEMTLAEAKATMSADIDLGDGVTLSPQENVQASGTTLAATYGVNGTPEDLKGLVRTMVGDHGIGIAMIAIAPPDEIAFFRTQLDALVASTALTAPQEPQFDWHGQLAGRKITRFYTVSGYTEQTELWLCRNGAVFRNAQASGFGGGASGAYQSRGDGRWRVTGSGPNDGRLDIEFHGGTSTWYDLSLDGTKLMLDGKRWFREDAGC